MMPRTMGMIQPTRAVVLGTKNASTKPTKIIPATMRFVLEPTLDKIVRAIRLSSPVVVMAAARNMAAPTSMVPPALNPLNVMVIAWPKPICFPAAAAAFSRAGDVPSSRSINDAIIVALTG